MQGILKMPCISFFFFEPEWCFLVLTVQNRLDSSVMVAVETHGRVSEHKPP